MKTSKAQAEQNRGRTKKNILIRGKTMTYVEIGAGAPIVFLHGNPTSSFLWRDVMPPIAPLGRCIAPDLIGMGDSDKLDHPGPDSYRFVTHRDYLWKFLDAVVDASEPVVLVLHDWGSALGFDWARQHPDHVRALVYMEAIVRPFTDWSEWSPDARAIFQGFRSEKGENLILERNLFVERVLPGSILRKLSDEEMAEYRRPFPTSSDRWPTLTWPRQIPVAGEPADVTEIVEAYAQWMAQNATPKLFMNAEPGAILTGPAREFCRQWKNQTEISVAGVHFIQEDSGAEIGQAIARWLSSL